jgi:hypothetical protein
MTAWAINSTGTTRSPSSEKPLPRDDGHEEFPAMKTLGHQQHAQVETDEFLFFYCNTFLVICQVKNVVFPIVYLAKEAQERHSTID